MAEPKQDPFDAANEDEASEYDALGKALHHYIEEFAEEHELSEGAVAMLLLDISVRARMADYVLTVEKPSGAGLKLELDRFRRDFDAIMRTAKKGADGFVAHAKEALAQAAVEFKADEEPE